MDDDNEDNFLAEIVGEAPRLPNLSDSEVDRFASEVRQIVESRAIESWASEDDVSAEAAFVYVHFPRQPLGSAVEGLERVVDLRTSNEPILGRIFFLDVSASNGTWCALPCDLNNILDWLEGQGLADSPVLLVRKETLRISCRSCIADENPRLYPIRTTPSQLSVPSLLEALQFFHETQLITPTACHGELWEKGRSDQYVPCKDTEKVIQKRLSDMLWNWFRGQITVETEDTVPKGRIDVRILTAGENSMGLQYWTIIELKVARSFHNAPEPKKPNKYGRTKLISDLVKGIQQAGEFTANREVSEGFLEIYDMRQDKSVDLLNIPKFVSARAQCPVDVNVFSRDIYGSAEDARKAGYTD